MVSYQRWTLTIERELDGIRILKRLAGLTAGEVLAVRYEEQALPGELVLFYKSKYEHGDVNDDKILSIDNTESVFDLLRKSFTNELTKEKA